MRKADATVGQELAQSFGLKISLDGQRGVFDACTDDIVSVMHACRSGADLLDTCYIIYSLAVPN